MSVHSYPAPCNGPRIWEAAPGLRLGRCKKSQNANRGMCLAGTGASHSYGSTRTLQEHAGLKNPPRVGQRQIDYTASSVLQFYLHACGPTKPPGRTPRSMILGGCDLHW